MFAHLLVCVCVGSFGRVSCSRSGTGICLIRLFESMPRLPGLRTINCPTVARPACLHARLTAAHRAGHRALPRRTCPPCPPTAFVPVLSSTASCRARGDACLAKMDSGSSTAALAAECREWRTMDHLSPWKSNTRCSKRPSNCGAELLLSLSLRPTPSLGRPQRCLPAMLLELRAAKGLEALPPNRSSRWAGHLFTLGMGGSHPDVDLGGKAAAQVIHAVNLKPRPSPTLLPMLDHRKRCFAIQATGQSGGQHQHDVVLGGGDVRAAMSILPTRAAGEPGRKRSEVVQAGGATWGQGMPKQAGGMVPACARLLRARSTKPEGETATLRYKRGRACEGTHSWCDRTVARLDRRFRPLADGPHQSFLFAPSRSTRRCSKMRVRIASEATADRPHRLRELPCRFRCGLRLRPDVALGNPDPLGASHASCGLVLVTWRMGGRRGVAS